MFKKEDASLLINSRLVVAFSAAPEIYKKFYKKSNFRIEQEPFIIPPM